MQENRWQKIEGIFNRAAVLPFAQREDFIKRSCENNEALCREILHLVKYDTAENNFLEEDIFSLGAQLLEENSFHLLSGTQFSHYTIEKLLGRGGMGAVYLAKDNNLERLAALKILPPSLTESPDSRRRFQREAKAASAISHLNVAHIYEFGETEGRCYLAMEYIKGKTLRESLRENPPGIANCLDIISQIANAISTAHRCGIIHRDVKPENIIIGDDGLIKILDFGLAKFDAFGDFQKAESAPSPDTLPGLIMGTVSYMSPEQLRSQPVNSTTDIWSLGVIFYEILTGARPFDGETQSDTMAAILKTEPVPPRKINSEISPRLEDIVLKTLQKESKDRYQSLKNFLNDLQEIKKNADFEVEYKQIPATDNAGKSPLNFIAGYVKKHKNLFLACLAALFFTSGWFQFRSAGNYSNEAANTETISSLAVLPFTNESANTDEEYLSDGITEALINTLSQIPNLRVKARGSVFHYKGKNIDPQTVGRELSVQAVLIGRILKNENDLMLNLEMLDARTGSKIWSKQYKRNPTDIISLRKEISKDVSSKLQPLLSDADKLKLAKNYTENIEAYNLYLKGRFYWSKRTSKDLQKSLDYFERAIALDPNFALAYAGLADTYVLLSGYGTTSPHDSFPKAREAARRALEIDDSLAEAHTALAYVLFNYDWNFAESEAEIKRAIELNPNYATAHHWYGNANLTATGRLDESIAEVQKALELDPLSLIINADLGTEYLFARQPDKAVEQYKKTIEMDENFYYAHAYLGRAYMMKGLYREALNEFQKAQTLGDDPRILMLISLNYALWGKRAEALKTLEQMKKLSKQRYVSAYYFALVYTGLGENDEAFGWLEKALQDREGRMTLIKVDPLLDGLRSDSRFPDLLKRVGL